MSAYDTGLVFDATPQRCLDPRWDWAEVTAFGDRQRTYVPLRCRHESAVKVELALTGEHVADLCLTCQAQLPPCHGH